MPGVQVESCCRKGQTMHTIAWWSNVAILSLASAIDIRTRRIPNWLSVPFFVAGMVAQVVANGWQGLGDGIAGTAVALSLFGPACFLGWMGMGDLKLAAGVAAWIGTRQFLFAFVAMGMVGGVLAAAAALRHGVLWTPPRTAREKELAIPYAPAIAIGALFSFFL